MGSVSRDENSQALAGTSNSADAGSVQHDAGLRIPSVALLAVLVLICLTPFLSKAYHIDDTLFVWAAQQIAKHPWNPYGFDVVWYTVPQHMWAVTQNPPLASYYIAAIAGILGWSETVLHAGFLLAALGAILGTYLLARRLTRRPLLAAVATLAAPGFLVSSTTVMCDIMMLALWVFAILFWLDALDRRKPLLLAVSGVLIAVCALTKYFGMALIPMLLVYSIVRRRRVESWIVYLLLPVVALAGYQYWTNMLYGRGLLDSALQYAHTRNSVDLYKALVGLSFTGGCALPALTFAPVVWSRRRILLAGAAAVIAGLLVRTGILSMPSNIAPDHRTVLSLQMVLFIAGGLGVLALAFSDWRRRQDAGSVLLLLWVLGTWGFASFVNWSVNARSVLPMIPAVGILLARRFELVEGLAGKLAMAKWVVPLVVSAAISLWVAWADATLANSSRLAAEYVRDRLSAPGEKVSFEGHWGFQYYMQAFRFQPVDFRNFTYRDGDLVVVPHNNSNAAVESIPPFLVASQETFAFPIKTRVSTMSLAWGSGFYSDVWGPLPYAFGPAYFEVYTALRLRVPPEQSRK